MIDLNSTLLRLNDQFLDPHQLALPESLKIEAIRASLAEMNSILGTTYTLTGLDSANQTTLTEHLLPALFRGAAATILEAIAFHNHTAYSNLPADRPDFETWSRSLRQERDQLLDGFRLHTLHQSTGSPWGAWRLEETEYDG